MAGWGGFLGKIADYFQGRAERRRNSIEDIKRKMSEIQARSPFTDRDAREYERLAGKLRTLEQHAKND